MPSKPKRSYIATISWFLGGQAISLIGSAMVGYTVIWHVTIETKSGWALTVLTLAQLLPQGIMSAIGGVWADRYSRKKLVIAGDAVVATVTAGMAVAFWLGEPSLVALVVLMSVRSLCQGVQVPAVSAIIPSLVPETALMRVNGVNGSIQAACFLGAPALAGVLLQFNLPLWQIMLIDVATAAMAIAILAAIRVPAVDGNTERHMVKEMADAGRFIWRHPALRRVMAGAIVLYVLVMPPAELTPLAVTKLFGEEPWQLATVELAWAVGMILGGVIVGAWGGLRNRMTMILLMSMAWAVCTLALGLSPSYWFFAGVWVAWGMAGAGLQAGAMTGIQEATPPELLGRVMGLVMFVMALAGPLGMVVAGPLADVISVRVIFWVGGGVALVFIALLGIRAPALMGPDKKDKSGDTPLDKPERDDNATAANTTVTSDPSVAGTVVRSWD